MIERTSVGRLFHAVGPATMNAHSQWDEQSINIWNKSNGRSFSATSLNSFNEKLQKLCMDGWVISETTQICMTLGAESDSL